MESLTRLVAESLARHGFDRPLDYRRLSWSRWFRCESHHSLLFVPSKPGVFALAEEIAHVEIAHVEIAHVATAASAVPRSEASGPQANRISQQFANPETPEAESRKPEAVPTPRRMLAVTQFFEADDMAFVLDRMLSRHHPMSARLASGRYFVRFVAIEDETQRTTICNALNQWMVSTAEKATGIGPHFATSLELTPATEYVPPVNDAQQTLFADANANREGHDFSRADRAVQISPALAAEGIAGDTFPKQAEKSSITPPPPHAASPQLDSGAATNIHCPSPFPSGF
jgi:hypothetical protein